MSKIEQQLTGAQKLASRAIQAACDAEEALLAEREKVRWLIECKKPKEESGDEQ